MVANWFGLKDLAAEMKRLQRRDRAPDEELWFPPSIEEGDGIMALLELLFGTAGYAETGRRIGLYDDYAVGFFLQLFSEAARNLQVTDVQLKQTYANFSADDGQYIH